MPNRHFGEGQTLTSMMSLRYHHQNQPYNMKRKNRSKRSLSSLPKGLVSRGDARGGVNPFEASQESRKRTKFQVHNRNDSRNKPRKLSALAQAIQGRQTAVREAYRESKKANSFVDKRIGEYSPEMTEESRAMARLVKERSRQSKRHSKYSLNDDDNDILTHKGKVVDPKRAVILSDDDEEDGDLDAVDTSMHFGGGGQNSSRPNPYASYGPSSDGGDRLSDMYQQRKTDLDELIQRRKERKAASQHAKEMQSERFASMDDSFAELRDVLDFRDKEAEIRKHHTDRRKGTLSAEDQEMVDWDKEMKTYLHLDRKVKASDRTKTPDEIAKEEAERLHELETRRLARMNGDFDDDDFSDISEDEGKKTKRQYKNQKKRRDSQEGNPEALSDSDFDNEAEEEPTTRFTADGLVLLDKDGNVVGKVGEDKSEKAGSDSEEGDEDSGGDHEDSGDDGDDKKQTNSPLTKLASELTKPLPVGAKVEASYRATEQYDGNESWYPGVVVRVHKEDNTYDVEYDDGDYEDGVQAQHIKFVEKTADEIAAEQERDEEQTALQRKKLKAKDKARYDIHLVQTNRCTRLRRRARSFNLYCWSHSLVFCRATDSRHTNDRTNSNDGHNSSSSIKLPRWGLRGVYISFSFSHLMLVRDLTGLQCLLSLRLPLH